MKLQTVPNVLGRVVALAAFAAVWSGAVALQVPAPLVETGWLAEHGGQVVILDVRKDAASYIGIPPTPGKKQGLKKLTGHISGAVSVPWKKVIAKVTEQETELKSMLPAPEAFSGLMQASGVNNDSAVVIAGRGTTAKDQAFAARLYFTLKYFGHDNVALLNGGTAQWAKDGRPLVYVQEPAVKGEFAVTETREHLLAGTKSVEEAVESGDVQLVDCRTEDYFLGLNFKRGFVSPEHKGHLSDAKMLPFVLLADNFGPAKLFSAQEMRDVAALKGVDLDTDTIAYCNTGVTASLGWFALHELLGNAQTRLYDGSMHAWSKLDPTHPVVALAEASTEGSGKDAGGRISESMRRGIAFGPATSLQTLVDERRDSLRRRRNDYFDAVSGRRNYLPAWMAAREDLMDGYRDSVRAAHRQHRDAMRLYRDAMHGAYAAWTRPYRDAAEIRHFISQMEQLDRQELVDGQRFSHANVPW